MFSARKLNSLLLPFTFLSWAGLLACTLLYAHPAWAAQLGTPPEWLLLLAQAVFTAAVFMHERTRPERLRGLNFIGMLRQLVTGPALLATACVGLHLLEQFIQPELPAAGSVWFTVLYTINVGLFVLLVARTNYVWRSLVLFRSSGRLRQQWVWFEVLLAATLLLRLVPWPLPPNLLAAFIGALAVFGAYLSSHQKWVAYLSRRQKVQAVLLQLAVLLAMGLFVVYFLHTRHSPQLVAPVTQHAFLVLNAFFAIFYAAMGLLVTTFNLPTAGVFEQKREELLTLQRLSQLIQRGQSAEEVYRTFFDSSIQAVGADAAWLAIDGSPDDEPLNHYHRVEPEQAAAIRSLLSDYNLGQIEYFNNNLDGSSGFRELALPFGSLIVMPLRSAKRHYGALHLLKEHPQGFDRENLSILQTFASQTVLSIENLQLVRDSIQNERVKEELKIASSVQDSLIPKNLPIDNWFEISSHALAAREVGGDFYDFLHLPGRRLAILIGDVSGKGVTAAFHMAQMKGIFHALMQENPLARDEREKFPVPSRFMAMANKALVHCLERSSFITASLYIIDYEHGGFVFARAGHCHTLYYHSIKEEVSYFRTAGLGLGIIRNDTYEKHIKNQFYDYNPGDVMVIYTDGIVEARGAGQEEYGEERLQQMLERTYYLDADQIKQHILDDLYEFSRGQPMHDDQTLLVIKFKAAQPDNSL
ncbi:PP2C family protein-serine/threonine phosphatase [Hymenobacter weizhouensis]|uniref:PP2C family protein-serine/threonine phosphatase n=1 Tax=Hymenobacter sp. YIM 151500-1 TaxID=2987689 RepID=UPI0022270CA9|nr:SpoIIE family protein phosphatase [Hymenobacter sp. YIM 151500-1]UYZ62999.1 SpoIIE family protein phosphatase [Hymenobacter sp. YIM 151500-1]